MRDFQRLFVVLLLVTVTSGAGAQMRCGTALLKIGDYKAQVLLECGEPLLRDQFHEGVTFSCRVSEQWTYDPGPGRFLHLLTFEEGRLRQIEQIQRP